MPGAIVEEEKSQIESIKEQLKLEKEDDVVVEDVKDGEEEDDDEDDENVEGEGEGEGGNENSKQSRSEKKSRKAVLKLGVKGMEAVGEVVAVGSGLTGRQIGCLFWDSADWRYWSARLRVD